MSILLTDGSSELVNQERLVLNKKTTTGDLFLVQPNLKNK